MDTGKIIMVAQKSLNAFKMFQVGSVRRATLGIGVMLTIIQNPNATLCGIMQKHSIVGE